MSNFHTPVLLKEVINFLKITPGEKYIDATLGGGGHTGAILEKNGIVLGIDIDQEALDYVEKNFKFQISDFRLMLARGNFKDLDEIARLKIFTKVKGILFDLGVSSHQIDIPQRGFSFLRKGPLDMRMDRSSPVTADVLINLLTKGELNDIFNKLGQESRFKSVSDGIIKSRRIKAILTTEELSGIVEEAYGIRGDVSDFTKNKVNKKVFQALRIAVNRELENIEEALPKALLLLDKGGRIVVISFHSLEDGVVKRMFKKFQKENLGKIIIEKPVLPSYEEISENSRARSAKLRVFEKN